MKIVSPNRIFVFTPFITIVALGLIAMSAWAVGIGSAMPSFSLKNVDGKMVSASDFAAGKALVVIFAANSCPYSQAYQDRLIALQNGYASKGVQFVLISSNDAKKQPKDSYEAMQARATEKKYPFPYLYDESQAVAKSFGASRTPEVFAFDQSHRLVYHGRIDDNTEPAQVSKSDLKEALDLILAGTPDKIAAPETKAFGCTIKWKE